MTLKRSEKTREKRYIFTGREGGEPQPHCWLEGKRGDWGKKKKKGHYCAGKVSDQEKRFEVKKRDPSILGTVRGGKSGSHFRRQGGRRSLPPIGENRLRLHGKGEGPHVDVNYGGGLRTFSPGRPS